MLSIFDVFKIGLGPSSSHTNGPMLACATFLEHNKDILPNIYSIKVDLYGSLSLTGRGHYTDRAVIYGLLGFPPDKVYPTLIQKDFLQVIEHHNLLLGRHHDIHFDPTKDIIFNSTSLKYHANGMKISAFNKKLEFLKSQVYYSTGGGFIATEEELKAGIKVRDTIPNTCKYPFKNAEELLQFAIRDKISLANIALQNELSIADLSTIDAKIAEIWDVIVKCIDKGLITEGILNTKLNIVRRAPEMYKQLTRDTKLQDPLDIMDWVDTFAMAVSEENASLGRIVTSPTNGSAGVIPAVLKYYDKFIKPLDTLSLRIFFLTAGTIGQLYKRNASVAGAEVGCQGEIGVSASMAAAGLNALMGGNTEQILNAAEIAMEHFLGMTCDPIDGLVLIPCIERNAMGAIKAINASRLSMRRETPACIKLDNIIHTMYITGQDMNAKYRETSLGGLAVFYSTPC